MISNSLNHHYFQMKTDMNVKIGSYTKLCMQNKILASKMQNIKQQKTSVSHLLSWKGGLRKVSYPCEKSSPRHPGLKMIAPLRDMNDGCSMVGAGELEFKMSKGAGGREAFYEELSPSWFCGYPEHFFKQKATYWLKQNRQCVLFIVYVLVITTIQTEASSQRTSCAKWK